MEPGPAAPGSSVTGAAAEPRALAHRWETAARADDPCSPEESAMQSWRPRTRSQYASRLWALAAYAERTGPPNPAATLARLLAERAQAGATASALRGIISAIRAVEDLQWLPPTVTALHKRIAAGAASSGSQPYLSPAGRVKLVERTRDSRNGTVFSALAIISRVCYLPVGEAAGIKVSDLAMAGFVQFWNSKTGREGYTTRPLGVRAWLHRHMVSLGRSLDMLVWQSGEAGLEAGMAEALTGMAYARARWHALRRRGAAATWARKPDLAYYKWWGRWQSTALAMQYGTKWSDPGVITPTVLPAWSPDRRPLPTPGSVGVLALWGSPMFPNIAGALSTPTKRKPRHPRGEGPGTTEGGTIGSGEEGDQAATELQESAEDGPAEMGPEPEAAPTPPPLQSLAPASGGYSGCCGGGGGVAGRGRQPGPSMSIPMRTPTTTVRVPEANPMAPSQLAAPGVPPGVDRPELPRSLHASVNCGPPGQLLVLSEEGPERARNLEWWAVSTAHTRGRVALRWSWVVRRPCDPEPPHAVKLGDLVLPSRSICRSPSAPSSGQAGMSRRRRRKTRWRVPSWLQLSASRPRLGGRRCQWRRPPPSV